MNPNYLYCKITGAIGFCAGSFHLSAHVTFLFHAGNASPKKSQAAKTFPAIAFFFTKDLPNSFK